jgi:hypothetical protein
MVLDGRRLRVTNASDRGGATYASRAAGRTAPQLIVTVDP